MKRYLQGCELGGSIYGKKGKPGQNDPKDGDEEKEDLMKHCRKLYNNQVNIMNRVFRTEK